MIFHYVQELTVFSKNLPVFTLINQLMQMLSSRYVMPNECSRNAQKVVEKINVDEKLYEWTL